MREENNNITLNMCQEARLLKKKTQVINKSFSAWITVVPLIGAQHAYLSTLLNVDDMDEIVVLEMES